MKKITEKLNQKWAKICNIISVTIISMLGICISLFGLKSWWWLIPVVICLLYTVVYEICNIVFEMNHKDALNEALKQKRVYEEELSRIAKFDKQSTINTYEASKKIKRGQTEVPIEWGFRKRGADVCENILRSMFDKTACDKLDVLLTIKKGNSIITSAYAIPEGRDIPRICEKNREITSEHGSMRDQQYFAKYIKAEPEMEVSSEYKITDDRLYKNNGKYGQYVFVPFKIGGKLVGIIEVFADRGNDIGKSDEEIKEIAKKIIYPYVQQLSLLYSIEELMKAGPTQEGEA